MINNIKNNTISDADTKKKTNELNEIKTNSRNDNNNNNNNNNKNNNSNGNNNEIESENVNENENENENKSDDEQYYEIKQINNNFKKIDETKSFEDQIDILKKIPWLNDYWYIEHYEDSKETNLRLFKLKFEHVFNDVDDNLFEEIFGLTSVKLAHKLINTTSKEENKMLVNNIETNRDKIFEQYEYSKFVIHPPHKRGDLLDVVKIILEFNKTIQSYLT